MGHGENEVAHGENEVVHSQNEVAHGQNDYSARQQVRWIALEAILSSV